MKISAVPAWAVCEAMALHDPPPQGRVSAAAWVGRLAHEHLTGDSANPPDLIAFDTVTPSWRHAETQAKVIAALANLLLAAKDWTIRGVEEDVKFGSMTGRLDLRCWHTEKGVGVFDLKTGRADDAWLQVAGYLCGVPEADWGGILHIPRVATRRISYGVLYVQEAEPLREQFRDRMQRILEVLDGAKPLRSPGSHCVRCTDDCPVRAIPSKPDDADALTYPPLSYAAAPTLKPSPTQGI